MIRHSNALSLAKLSEKSEIVLEKKPNIVDTKLQHRDALHPHAKCESGDFFRVIFDEAKNRRVDHSGAEYFQPASGFTNAAGLLGGIRSTAAANEALNVDLRAGLGEREKTRAKAHSGFPTEDLPQKMR